MHLYTFSCTHNRNTWMDMHTHTPSSQTHTHTHAHTCIKLDFCLYSNSAHPAWATWSICAPLDVPAAHKCISASTWGQFDSFLLRNVWCLRLKPPADKIRRHWEHFKVRALKRPRLGHRKLSWGCQQVRWTILNRIWQFCHWAWGEAVYQGWRLHVQTNACNNFQSVNTISFNVLMHKQLQIYCGWMLHQLS